MSLTIGDVLFLVAALGLVVLLVCAPKLLGALVTFHEWLGKKLEEQRLKRERTDDEDE